MKLEESREVWRREYPWTERIAYFQHAFNSPLPRSSIEEVLQYFINQSDLGFVQSDANIKAEETRRNLAEAINAKPEEIAITQSYTEGLNIATHNLSWKGKKNIVVGEGDYGSTLVHFVNLLKKRRDAELRVIPMDKDGFCSVERAKELIDGETALVHLVHVPNEIGTIQPVETIFRYAHSMGALTVVDAAQSTGLVPHGVHDLSCDYYSSVGKKWLMGPVGTAFFWCREELIEDLEPTIVGKHILSFDLNKVNLVKTAERFESTTPNHPGIVGLGSSVRHSSKIGIENINSSVKELIKYLIDGLINECDAEIVGTIDTKNRTGITCFTIKGMNSVKLVEDLKKEYFVHTDARGLSTPTMKVFSGEVVRVSTHFYNSHGDIDRLIRGVKELKKAKK